jgi:lysophospholipid acyltransferase (LPLAT)-like uncharacterized protein
MLLAMRFQPPPLLVNSLAGALLRSLRVHHYGLERARSALSSSRSGSIMVCHWHQSLLSVLAPALDTRLRLAVLTSLSADGDIITSFLESVGIRAVRGSSRRGAARAAKDVMTALQEGWTVSMAVDGPKGPARVVKSGPLEIARREGVTVIPIAARASSEVSFNRSWDRFRLPLPGAHIAMIYGEPVTYPPQDPSPQELELRTATLRDCIDTQEKYATRLVRQFAPRSRFRPLMD